MENNKINNHNNNALSYDLNKEINSSLNKNLLFSSNKKKKYSKLILKYENIKLNRIDKKISQKKHKYYSATKDTNSLFKTSPKHLLSSLENNILLGKLSLTKTSLLPKISFSKNSKNQISNLKLKYSYNYNMNKNNNRNKDRFMLSISTQNFNSQKDYNSLNSNDNIRNEINVLKSGEDFHKKKSFYTYVIRPENCGYLIKNCFKHRKNWKEIDDLSYKNFNFKWQQTTRGINYDHLSLSKNKKQMVNHFEFLGVISNKANLFINMMQYAESKNQNVFKFVPFTVLFDYNKMNIFNELTAFEYLFKNINEYIVSYNEMDKRNYKKDKDKLYGFFFPFIERIGNKTVINIPDTHFISSKSSIYDFKKSTNLTKIKNNYWIIKAPDLNRGMCIKIVNSLILIKRSIREYSMGIRKGYNDKNNNDENFNNFNSDNDIYFKNEYENNNKNNISFKNTNYSSNHNYNYDSLFTENNYRSNICVIQKYIEKPLLYFGRKFDIRIWVLLTQNMSVYMFKEGHLKCCSINYDLSSNNTFCHLTNYSFQKYSSNFGKYEFGNEVSFSDFQKNIDINYDKNINFKNDVLPKIKEIIKFTFESVKNKINPIDRKYSFEIFGFDFMLDCNFQPFLIEVNSNPGLEESSPLIKMLIPRMLDDALRLTIDKEFETIYDFNFKGNNYFNNSNTYHSPFHVEGYSDEDNMFEHICDLNDEDINFKGYNNFVNYDKLFFKKTFLKKHFEK